MLSRRKYAPINGAPRRRVQSNSEDIICGIDTQTIKAVGICVAVFVVGFLVFGSHGSPENEGSFRSGAGEAPLNVLSWNIAAINNNPFEYWITYEDIEYERLMQNVQDLVQSPGARDVPVSDIFTSDMFDELKANMLSLGWNADHIAAVEDMWTSEYSKRRSVSGILKDPELGLKRLVSMPDRVTNTINLNAERHSARQAYRPAVHNCYQGDLDSLVMWWGKWKRFMFEDGLVFAGSQVQQRPVEKLGTIKRSKYPAVTPLEERISLPLQTLMLAIFDAILVNTMLQVSTSPSTWQVVRKKICSALNMRKNDRILEILGEAYRDRHIVFLQEVAGAFLSQATEAMSSSHTVVSSKFLNRKRDQNSVILLRNDFFVTSSVVELTASVEETLEKQTGGGKPAPVAQGDIFAITVRSRAGDQYFLVSFHGDTNGLATIPVLRAIDAVYRNMPKRTLFIFGLDANTYEHAVPGKQQDVLEFARFYVSSGLTSCW
eukprot:g4681.t1